ncbi:MAG TPA: hypothetical protein PKG48_08040 [Bacteroidales bacterium]|nr:hypothetical protein [Bacteroidales bacterium]
MKKFCLILGILVAGRSAATPAGYRYTAGGRAAALGGIATPVTDSWSAFNNPAGTAFLPSACVMAGAVNSFLLPELTVESLGLALPLRRGAFGLTAGRSGDDRYSEISATVSFSLKLAKKFSAGVRIGYLRTRTGQGYGSRNGLLCETGLLYQASRTLTVGIRLLNPVPFKLSARSGIALPTTLSAGISATITDGFILSAEAVRETGYPIQVRTGAELRLVRSAYIRTGFSSAPALFTFGGGLLMGRITIDIASGYHPVLGFSPAVSLSYSFR